MTRQFTFIALILIFPAVIFAQEPQIEAPLPPPPPRPFFSLLPSEKEDYEKIKRQIESLKGQQLIILDSLKLIALNVDTLAVHRLAAIELIGNLDVREAYHFLIEHIDLFVYRLDSTRPSDYENFPCFDQLWEKQPEVSMRGVIASTDILDKCLTEKQLKYIYLILVRDIGSYRFPEELHKYIVHFQYPHNQCKQQNLKYLREYIDKIGKRY